MSLFSSLTRNQKESIGLLQIGTFLEYFDLTLYLHMAVLLDSLFFPKTDSHTAALISASAFCSIYIFRPFGALLFGYIGDTFGRRSTVVITTAMMSISCIVMANLPTYADIGIAAAWIVTICRITQGLSSMGEIMGATIYTTEITKPPLQYTIVSLVDVFACFGGIAALGIAVLVTQYEMNWRIAFWIGAGIAVIGSVARTKLRETPEWVDARRKISNSVQVCKPDEDWDVKSKKLKEIIKKEKISRTTTLAFFASYCGWPLSFYLTYMYFNPTLKMFGYTAENIIFHNFLLSIFQGALFLFLSIISCKISPLKISQWRGCGFLILTLVTPFLLMQAGTARDIFLMQICILTFSLSALPSNSIFIKHFPILKRFTAASVLYALTRVLMYIFTSFGLVYLTEWFGHYGLWIVMFPVTIAYLWGIRYFQYLENSTNRDSMEKADYDSYYHAYSVTY